MHPCRICAEPLCETFADLGFSPLANSYLRAEDLERMEPHYPLHAYVCSNCLLVQLTQFESPQRLFSDYAYFSSFSTSWLEHAHEYAGHMTARFDLNAKSLVLEVASNDGYLLQWFQKKGIGVLGIEPAANIAEVARERGIPTRAEFFGADLAGKLQAEGIAADLIAANNVLAHVPNILDFIAGMKIVLKPRGVITFEFPHLLNLIQHNQFDTIYHEHFSYLSLHSLEVAFAKCGLAVFDIDFLNTHGGSLRVYVRHTEDTSKPDGTCLALAREHETSAGLHALATYTSFGDTVANAKSELLSFLIECRRNGKSVAGYGAPAKGNTLLNYCGVGPELLPFTVDRSPHKQGLYLPGTRIPIAAPERIEELRPDYVLILPWNLRTEIVEQMAMIREWGGQFVAPIPSVEVF
jgi:SAM-dependent methyltransferase